MGANLQVRLMQFFYFLFSECCELLKCDVGAFFRGLITKAEFEIFLWKHCVTQNVMIVIFLPTHPLTLNVRWMFCLTKWVCLFLLRRSHLEISHGNVYSEVFSKVVAYQHGVY